MRAPRMRWTCQTGNEQPPGRCLWPPSNKRFVPAPEPLIFIYVNPGRALSFARRGWVHFITINFRIRRAAVRQCAAAFSMAVSYARCSLASSVAALAGRVGARWDTTLRRRLGCHCRNENRKLRTLGSVSSDSSRWKNFRSRQYCWNRCP